MYSTYEEYLATDTFDVVRRMAMEASGWSCKCGARATQVHHAKGYPPWGTFDLPSNLTPICHKCHCAAHGK